MINVEIERPNVVNPSALHRRLATVLGEQFSGISQQEDSPFIVVHLLIDAPDEGLEELAKQHVLNFVDTPPEAETAPLSADAMIAELMHRIEQLEQRG